MGIIEAVGRLQPWTGTMIRVIYNEDFSRPVKLLAWLPGISMETAAVLKKE